MAWVRVDKPEYGNPFYNRKADGGYSSCCAGNYNSKYYKKYKEHDVIVPEGKPAPGYTALPNCVGLANGAFNETYVRNKQLKDLTYTAKEYYSLCCNARDFITRAKSIGLPTLPETSRPPLGGIIVYGKDGANHVAFITNVIDDDTCEIIQSGYGGWNGSKGWDPVWPNAVRRIYRSAGWEDGNGDANKCIGFVVNPSIEKNDDNADPAPIVKLSSVSLNTSKHSIQENMEDSLSIAYSPTDYDISKTTATWKSSDTNIVTVDSTGKIKAIETGKATITVTVVDDNNQTFTSSCEVTVTADPAEVTAISISDVTLNPKQTYPVPVSVQPDTADLVTTLTWTSSNSKVATVDSSGIVTTIRGGKTTITVKTVVDGNELISTATITVNPRRGVYIKGNFYTPYIFHNGKWRRASANIGKNKKWKNSIEDISKNS